MTDREKAIVMAHTGICMLEGEKLGVFYQYLNELYGRPVYTHELVILDIKEKSKPDFLQLCKEEEPERRKRCDGMSVLIKGMEMPKDCPMCPMAHFNKLDRLTGCDVVPGKRYVKESEAEYWQSDKRPNWCPLIQVTYEE